MKQESKRHIVCCMEKCEEIQNTIDISSYFYNAIEDAIRSSSSSRYSIFWYMKNVKNYKTP